MYHYLEKNGLLPEEQKGNRILKEQKGSRISAKG